MKNVRLFAVAAALGMFASTVAAAETTKTTVEWTGNDTVIKVDLGEKLIAPTLTATVTLDKETAECEGDTNKDGLVDGNVYAVNPEVNKLEGWLYTNAKYWPTNQNGTAKYYLGLNGARILAPGAEENEGSYVVQLAHKNLEDSEAVFTYLEENGLVETITDEDGEVVAIKVGSYTIDDGSEAKNPVALVEGFVSIKDKRKALETAQEEIVDYFVNGTALKNTSDYYELAFTKVAYLAKETAAVYKANNKEVKAGDIVLVTADRKGNYSYVGTVKASSRKTLKADEKNVVATGSDITKAELAKGQLFLRVGTATDVQFTASDVVTLAKSTTPAYDTTHAIVKDTTKPATGVVINKEIVDLTKLSYLNAKNEYVSVSTLDADKITYANITKNDTKVLYGTKVVDIKGATFVTEATFDYVEKDTENGYEKISAESVKYGYWTVDGKTFYKADTTFKVFGSTSKDFNDVSSLGAADKITVVEVDGDFKVADYFNEDGTAKAGLTDEKLEDCYGDRLSTVTPVKNAKGALEVAYTFDLETLEFAGDYVKADGKANKADVLDAVAHTEGIYYVTSPENDSELYVLLTDTNKDYVGGVTLDNWHVNRRTETGYYEVDDEDDTVLDTLAVELDGAWYPAFETEAELVEFMYAVTGLNKALEGTSKDKKATSFKTWYDAAEKDLKAGIGELPEGETLPVTAIQPIHNAKKCEYTASSTSDAVTVVTTNTIDTTVAGVYDLEYAAKYDGEVVGTTSIKVVVAPNYTRTWENGRVKTLTSYYVNNPTAKYAEYNYNWAAGTAVVTYYNIDGSVADTATVEL